MRFIPVFLLLLFWVQACSSTKDITVEPVSVPESILLVPSGVDSSIAWMANGLADSAFVSWDNEVISDQLKVEGTASRAQSDSLWALLEMRKDTSDIVLNVDSTQFISSFNEGAESFIEMQKISSESDPSDEEITRYAFLLDQAIGFFEKALTFNPFDAQTRVLLAQLYSVKAGRLNQADEFEKSITILEKLSRLEKGDHVIFGVLAENYYVLGQYGSAAENYKKAAEVLTETAKLTENYFDEGSKTIQDSLNLFTYYYYEGQSHLQLFDEFKSREAFLNGNRYASTEEYRDIIEGELNFIDWDEGNIKASFARDSLLKLVNAGQPSNAMKGYRDLLLTLRSKRATDEIDWRIAILEYELGNTEKSAELFKILYDRIDLEASGMAADSTYQNI